MPLFQNRAKKENSAFNRKLSSKILRVKQDVIDFLDKDENFRICPEKKDFLRLGNLVKQKIYTLTVSVICINCFWLLSPTKQAFRPFWVTWANNKER